jgi:SET domain-containing protein
MNTSKVVVKRSKIHGRGLFAVADINRGNVIGYYTGPLLTQQQVAHSSSDCVYLWQLSNGLYIDGKNDLRYCNHSCDPNAHSEEVTRGGQLAIIFRARRQILAGEEVYIEYNLLNAEPGDLQLCHCGSPKCRGTMLAE